MKWVALSPHKHNRYFNYQTSVNQRLFANMAEALVSVIIEQLVSILHRQTEEGIRLVVGVNEEVEKLTSNFRAIKYVLEDAEIKQVKDSPVREWLDKLKDTSYDIDDVLDEWNTRTRKMQMKEAENGSKPMRKVCSLIRSYCSQVVVRYDIASKIKSLNKTVDVITKEKDKFNFRPMEGARKLERPTTTSLIDISVVRGRDDEKISVVDLLLSESSQGPKFSVISIVGMGGIGKTTLARLAFNHKVVKASFDVKIWVCVSEPFDEIEIAKAILESLKRVKPNLDKLESLMGEIRQSIGRKKFLLVLDDVWTEDPNNWEQLYNALQYGAQGSRILLTTRKENTAKLMGTTTTNMISLGKLPDEECWSLFSQIALSGRTRDECSKLEVIGGKIVGKCNGLPLAVKALGSLLSLKTNAEQWQSVLDSELWKLEVAEKGIFPPLLFSYYDLPSILRKCFSYCAVFPKDHKIDKDYLIKLWMAQGYLKIEGREDMEVIGEEYFENLTMRSLFQDFERSEYDGSIIGCKMHDIVHDFAQYLTKNECFTIDVDSRAKSRQIQFSNIKARHSMVIWEEAGSFHNSVYKEAKLRSLVVIHKGNFKDDITVPKLFDNLKCLRVLELHCDHPYHCYSITELPRGIKKLKHLRYLKLSHNWNISELPEAVCELYNLQILDVSDCLNLHKLPRGIGNLINLRHLFNDETRLYYMPKGFERLTCLRTLSLFAVSDAKHVSEACTLECLKNLKHLQGSLKLTRLGDVKDVGDAKNAELGSKKKIGCLYLDYSGFRSIKQKNKDDEVLEALQPSPDLEKLGIEGYQSKILFPCWLMSLNKSRMLTLKACWECEQLPPLGRLPSLESLRLDDLRSLKKVGNEFLGIENNEGSLSSLVIAFPKLKYLEFRCMSEWEEWDYEILKGEDIKIMPCLEHLKISGESKLKSIPKHLHEMRRTNKLEITGARHLLNKLKITGDLRF